MFEKGEFIVYGGRGVCEIMDVSTMDISGVSRDRLYYFLRPVNDRDGRIFTPVDNGKRVMRRILTRREADELIGSIPSIGTLWISDERQREQNYKQAIRSCECREWVRIIKTLWLRSQERLAQGKKVTAMDKKYLKQAEEHLYAELSASLDIPQERMRDYIAGRMEAAERV